MTDKFYRDDTFIEHACCYEAAIVTKCENGKGMYGGDVDKVCECTEEWADIILKALNSL